MYLDHNTHTWQQNTSLSDLLINSAGQVGDFTPILITFGRNFLTFVYLMINLDAGEFTLWAAFDDATTEELQAVDENNNPIDSSSVCTIITPPASSSSSPASPSGPSPSGPAPAGISSGAIAGIAIGAVAGVALVLVGAWLFIRHRKRQTVNIAPGSTPGVADNRPAYADKSKEGHQFGHSYELPVDDPPATRYEMAS